MREKKSRVNPEIFNDIVPYTLSLVTFIVQVYKFLYTFLTTQT